MKRKFFAAFLSFVICFSAFSFSSGAVTLSDEDKTSVDGMVYEADISEMHAMLVSGLITSRRLTEIYTERINEYNGTYNCFITLCDNALSEAESRDKTLSEKTGVPRLFGIPVVIGDDIDLAGEVSTRGESRKGAAAETDADVVKYLKESGAVIVGKTNISTAARALNYTISTVSGETKNAYSKNLSAGGSSGGVASSVSLNMAAAGIGGDSNGGLLLPAALNGCFALRTTEGSISTGGVYLRDSSGIVGGVARSAADLAIMTDGITGGKTSYFDNLNSDSLVGLRVGILTELSETTSFSSWTTNAADTETRELFLAAVAELEKCGVTVVEVSIPNLFDLYTKSTYSTGGAKTVADERYYSAFKKVLDDNSLSALIFPTYLSAPNSAGRNAEGYPIADYENFVITPGYLSSVLGTPEITVPVGRHSSGASVGMEISASRGEEQKLLNIAYSFEKRMETRETPTSAPSLYESGEKTVVKMMFKYKTGPFEFLNAFYSELGLSQ